MSKRSSLPDMRIDPDWQAYRAGRDAALDWILSRPVEGGDLPAGER